MSAADTLIEIALTLFCWAVQLGITAGIALLLGWLLKRLSGHGRLIGWALCTFAVLCALLAALTLEPPVSCSKEYRDELTQEAHGAVQSVSRGLYSRYLPLVPVCARVKEIVREGAEYTIRFDIHYLCFGRVGMAWSSDGIYNMEKQLVGY